MAIALDTSSSMRGDKLEAAKAACRTVMGQLRDGDRLSLASFATGVSPLGDGSEDPQRLQGAINSLQADGVTRTDLALAWLQDQLPPAQGLARVAVLITDGHATNRQGRYLEDTRPLLERVREFADGGITLFTVGLGDAANFNSDFLVQLGDRGRGGFLYADDRSSGDRPYPILQSRPTGQSGRRTRSPRLGHQHQQQRTPSRPRPQPHRRTPHQHPSSRLQIRSQRHHEASQPTTANPPTIWTTQPRSSHRTLT